MYLIVYRYPIFSEHFPAICTLQLHALNMSIPKIHYNENLTSSWYKYKWKDTLKMDFLNKLRHLFSDFLALHPMESISLNSFVLLEHLAISLPSTLAINC